jgi:cytochrome c553
MMVKVTWPRALITLALLATLGLSVAWLGIINIGASGGHWAITDVFLHWTMRNAVRTQTALTVMEPASDPSGITSAAGHYAASCAFCHGAPGEGLPPVMQAATPPVPSLLENVSQWSDPQLFWIIKHGVKFTAMPAWPSQQRDDEVRRMVAFVRQLPTLSPAQYRALAYGGADTRVIAGPVVTADEVLPDCARCHGADGRGRDQPDIPILAGQRAEYLMASLSNYVSGRRASGVMQPAAARLSPAARAGLARHFAALPGLLEGDARPPPAETAEDRLAATVVAHGLPDANLPACSSCHSDRGRRSYPLLAGQRAEYLAQRLRLWAAQHSDVVEARRSNEPMPVIARRIPKHLIEPLARYYAVQQAAGR